MTTEVEATSRLLLKKGASVLFGTNLAPLLVAQASQRKGA
jgi:hypothetical protein